MEKTYIVTWAHPSDIGGIMSIEDSAFSEGIRENAETFLERLSIFPKGNTLLLEEVETQRSARKPAGYFCSELWDEIPPPEPEFYALGHSMKERNVSSGNILYISSLAMMPGIKGQGRFLFNESLKLICTANPQIRSIILLVNELWLPARHIYETEGFRYTEVLKSFFSEHRGSTALHRGKNTSVKSDGLLMRKDLFVIE
jgi:ribosomal-protein-alanine N-acetyltransferase